MNKLIVMRETTTNNISIRDVNENEKNLDDKKLSFFNLINSFCFCFSSILSSAFNIYNEKQDLSQSLQFCYKILLRAEMNINMTEKLRKL